MNFLKLNFLSGLLSPTLSLLLPWIFWFSTTSWIRGSSSISVPSIFGILSIGFIISSGTSPSNIAPRFWLRTDHAYGELMYCKNKSFAFHLAPLLPALLFLFTSLIYIEAEIHIIARGIHYAIFGMIVAHSFVAFYFGKEIGLIRDDISLKIFRTGLFKRFLMVATISTVTVAIFFYTIMFYYDEAKSITQLNPFRAFGDNPVFEFRPTMFIRVFILAAALYLINLPGIWRARKWMDSSDQGLIFICSLAWASAVVAIVFFMHLMTSLAGDGIGNAAYNYLIHQLILMGCLLLYGLYLVLNSKGRTIKNLQQPIWFCKRRAVAAWGIFFVTCFAGSLFYVESSVYSILASVALFAAVCYALLSKKRLEDLIQERTYDLNQEKSKVDSMLLNILPAYVIEDLKVRGESQPKNFHDVAILFTDFVGFTKISSSMDPADLINELNEMFTEFDRIVMRRGAERIKTIGDAYMAVSGLIESSKDPAAIMIECAKDILFYITQRNEGRAVQWNIRIGFSVGKSVGGVVGKTKYLFDLFGDTINTASRMESNSEPMKINVSEQVYLRLKDHYQFIEREPIEVKGKGALKMYFLKLD